MRKTKLCQPWITLGKCQFGDRCNFAHGELELKSAEHMRKVRLVHGHMRTFAHTLAIALPRRERVGVCAGHAVDRIAALWNGAAKCCAEL